jgi:hypothetical protein
MEGEVRVGMDGVSLVQLFDRGTFFVFRDACVGWLLTVMQGRCNLSSDGDENRETGPPGKLVPLWRERVVRCGFEGGWLA